MDDPNYSQSNSGADDRSQRTDKSIKNMGRILPIRHSPEQSNNVARVHVYPDPRLEATADGSAVAAARHVAASPDIEPGPPMLQAPAAKAKTATRPAASPVAAAGTSHAAYAHSSGLEGALGVFVAAHNQTHHTHHATVAEGTGGRDQEAADDEEDDIDYTQYGDYDKKTVRANLKDPSMFWAWGKWHKFSPKTLWLFDNQSKFRNLVVKIITNRHFDQFIIFLIAMNSIMLGIRDYTNDEADVNLLVDGSDQVFVSFFALECILKILGMGFILEEGSYLRDAWNWLDFIVVVSSLLTEIPALQSVSGMRTFRLLRPLRSLTTMPSMKILISTLLASVSQLGGVLVLAIFFFTIFAILGVSLWSGEIHNRCRMTEFPVDGDWVADPNDARLCSVIRPCEDQRWCGSLPAASRSGDPRYYISPEIDLWRDTMIEDLNFGYSSFNHLPAAFLTIFQIITLEGWIDILHIFEDSYEPWFVNIYFLLCIIVCSFFVLNLTIAVMLLKYEEFDKSEKSSTHVQDLHEHGEQIGLPFKFVEFLIEQDNIQISQSGLKMLQKRSAKQESLWNQLIKSQVTIDSNDRYYQNPITTFCFYLVNAPIFGAFIMFIIMLNTIVLSMDKYPEFEPSTVDTLSVFNLIFTVIFTMEVILKLIGLGIRGYSADKFNIFDGVIVIISILEMVMAEEGGGPLSALRAFRLFRIFKLFRAGDLRTLLDSIAFTVLTIKDYTILLSLFIYVFALLGMSFFAGQCTFDEEGNYMVGGTPPRNNFDTVQNAALMVFEVMIGENWNAAMYDHMRTVGGASAMYFISLVILGNVIMLNLFLAILLGNFDRARNFGEKKKIFDAFDNLTKMGYKLNIAIAYLFDDADFSRYIEDKILGKGYGDREDGDEGEHEHKHGEPEHNNETHCEQEIKEVYYAMCKGTIEHILTGNKQLSSINDAKEKELKSFPPMSEEQRNKIIEILDYIKRQASLRKQRLEFQLQLKNTEEMRKELEKSQSQEVQEENLSSDSEEDQREKNWFELILDHIENSSLLIFPQNSFIRQCCQACIQSEDEEMDSGKSKEEANVTQVQPITPSVKDGGLSVSLSPSKMKLNKTLTAQDKNKLQLMQSPQQENESNKNLQSLQMPLSKQSTVMTFSQVMKETAPAKNNSKLAAKLFEAVIMTLIIISSITLVIDNPLSDPDSSTIIFVGYLDNCFTVLFTLEAATKIIAMGFLFNNPTLQKKRITPYIRNPWNILDFIVVVSSLIDFVVTIQTQMSGASSGDSESQEDAQKLAESLQSLKALRALRALRPLRMISRNQGMKLIVNALLSSLPSMTNVTIVCLLFLLIFAILGVGFFKGTFAFCEIDDTDLLEKIITAKDCTDLGGTWYHPKETFDNTFVATRTLFEMMSTEGWIDVMYRGIDSVDVGYQPKENNSSVPIIYFVIFMIFGSQFILNLFVGVIMDNFNKIKEKEELGSLFVTEDQRAWIDAQNLGLSKQLQKRIDPPKNKFRAKLYRLVNHSYFENFITFFIAFNTIIMAVKYDGIKESVETTFENLNYLFAFIFNMEMFLKLGGLGKQYFYSAWNNFDMVVVIGTDIGILLKFFSAGSSFSTAATVVRAFRIMRIVRLMRSNANVKIILDTLTNIIPQITNFIALMFLLLFIYAALGINVFSGVMYQDYIDEKNNFSTISNAIIILFRCSTGEDWNKVMHELSVTSESADCIDDQDYTTFIKNNKQLRGCGSGFSQIYFLTFTIIIAWLIMNLSVAAVIEGLENAKTDNSGIIEGDDVQNLLDFWMQYDPKATGWIKVLDFVCLVIELPAPFGNETLRSLCKFTPKTFQKAKNMIFNQDSYYVNEKRCILIKNKEILQILQSYKIKTYNGKDSKVHFKDIFNTLVKRVFQDSSEDFEISRYLKSQMKNKWLDKNKKLKVMRKSDFKLHQGYASSIIAKWLRRRKERQQKRLMEENGGNYYEDEKMNNNTNNEELSSPELNRGNKTRNSTLRNSLGAPGLGRLEGPASLDPRGHDGATRGVGELETLDGGRGADADRRGGRSSKGESRGGHSQQELVLYINVAPPGSVPTAQWQQRRREPRGSGGGSRRTARSQSDRDSSHHRRPANPHDP